jgi:hypothetical protein
VFTSHALGTLFADQKKKKIEGKREREPLYALTSLYLKFTDRS